MYSILRSFYNSHVESYNIIIFSIIDIYISIISVYCRILFNYFFIMRYRSMRVVNKFLVPIFISLITGTFHMNLTTAIFTKVIILFWLSIIWFSFILIRSILPFIKHISTTSSCLLVALFDYIQQWVICDTLYIFIIWWMWYYSRIFLCKQCHYWYSLTMLNR